jgi:hypothetical protein
MKASCSVSAKMSDSEENLPSDIELAAQSAIDTLIPAKSKERYEIVYKYFEEWMEIKKIREVSEGGPCLFCGTIREAKTILLMVPVFYVADDGVD